MDVLLLLFIEIIGEETKVVIIKWLICRSIERVIINKKILYFTNKSEKNSCILGKKRHLETVYDKYTF